VVWVSILNPTASDLEVPVPDPCAWTVDNDSLTPVDPECAASETVLLGPGESIRSEIHFVVGEPEVREFRLADQQGFHVLVGQIHDSSYAPVRVPFVLTFSVPEGGLIDPVEFSMAVQRGVALAGSRFLGVEVEPEAARVLGTETPVLEVAVSVDHESRYRIEACSWTGARSPDCLRPLASSQGVVMLGYDLVSIVRRLVLRGAGG
jgi:hypothetical protein